MSKSNYYKERVIQLLLFFAFMLPMGALAQNIQLNGTVTDVSGESVIGASVLEKGTTNGVITDIDGNFTLSVSPLAVTPARSAFSVAPTLEIGKRICAPESPSGHSPQISPSVSRISAPIFFIASRCRLTGRAPIVQPPG